MSVIQRLTDSTLLVTTDEHATLFDPGSHTFASGAFDLATLGDVTRVMITHEHQDHVDSDFVKWLADRYSDMTIYSNDAVADLLRQHGIEVDTSLPTDASFEDVLHEVNPRGHAPPNRAFTTGGLLTHTGDSRQLTKTAPILAMPLMAPWGSMTEAMELARRLRPAQVVPIHDFYLSEDGRSRFRRMARAILAEDGIEVIDLDWGQTYST